MSAVWPRLFGRSTLAPRFSSSLTISRWFSVAAACSRVVVEVRPSRRVIGPNASASPPLRSHLTTFCSSPRCADWWTSSGSDAGELIAARGRSVPLARRSRVAPPASLQPLVRAAPPLGAAAQSRSGKPSRARSLQRGGGAFITGAMAMPCAKIRTPPPLAKKEFVYNIFANTALWSRHPCRRRVGSGKFA
eukprot:scaffold17927_cov67-Phaeocystis_antarctica.AAC.3